MLTLRFPDHTEIKIENGITIELAAMQENPHSLAGGIFK